MFRRDRLLNTAFTILAFLLIFIGILGFVLPIVPGWIFVILGLILLGEESRVGGWIFRRLPHRIRNRLTETRKRYFRRGG